jgi:transcriptional regulator with XRE-family HTH domain
MREHQGMERVLDEQQVGHRVRSVRLSKSLDQRDLAERAGVSVSALRRLEAGAGSTLKTVIAVTEALGAPLVLPEVMEDPKRRRAPRATGMRPHLKRREERVSLELHRAVVRRLRTDSQGVREVARANLPLLRQNVRGEQAHGWLDEWERALDGSTEGLVHLCLRQDERGVDMRQVSPFAGVLSDAERIAAIRCARAW